MSFFLISIWCTYIVNKYIFIVKLIIYFDTHCSACIVFGQCRRIRMISQFVQIPLHFCYDCCDCIVIKILHLVYFIYNLFVPRRLKRTLIISIVIANIKFFFVYLYIFNIISNSEIIRSVIGINILIYCIE